MTAPNRIRELRSSHGLSQQALGDLAGCSKMTISDLERGNMELTLDYMRRLAAPLGVNPADLLLDADNPDRLTPEERELIRDYRAAEDGQKRMIMRIAEPVEQPDDDRRVA